MMDVQQIILLLSLGTLFLAPVTAADPGSSLQIDVGGERQISPSVTNPLTRQDTITLRFTGRAISEGLVSWEAADSDKLSCDTYTQHCNLTVPAKSSVEFFIYLSGSSYGQEPLVMRARSQLTDLEDEDSILINVKPRTASGKESAPGTTLPYLVPLALVAAIVAARRRNAL